MEGVLEGEEVSDVESEAIGVTALLQEEEGVPDSDSVELLLAEPHSALPLALAVPGGQAAHTTLSAPEKVFAGQVSQRTLPAVGAYLPAMQLVQAGLPRPGA